VLGGSQKYFKTNSPDLIMAMITKREDPDYIGVWEGDKKYGFFLLYVNERSQEKDKVMISGDIIDTLGLANFSGFIEEVRLGVHRIYFSKAYHLEKSTSTVLKPIINYDGQKEGKRYAGTWAHDEGDKGTFVLEDMLTVAGTLATPTVANILLKHNIDKLHQIYKKNKKI
jgi:hypothetical protein